MSPYEFLRTLSNALRALWLFAGGGIAVAVMAYFLLGIEQGVDVLLLSGERTVSLVLTVLSVLLLAFLIWYTGRMLSYIRQAKDDAIFEHPRAYSRFGIPAPYYQHIPRLLAYNCFVVVQLAVLRLPTMAGLGAVGLFFVFAFHNILYGFLVPLFSGKRLDRMMRVVVGILAAGYVTGLLWLVVEGRSVAGDFHPERHRFWLACLAMMMFVSQVLAVLFFVRRRRLIDLRRRTAGLAASSLLDIIGFNPIYNAAEAPYFRVLNTVAVISLLLYLAAIFVMRFSLLMGPMAFTLLGLGILTGLANLMSLASIRISFNVAVLLVALAVVLGPQRDLYEVRLLPEVRRDVFGDRADTRLFLRKWFERRIERMNPESEKPFAVYLVLANGGASRAGLWTSSVLGWLQDLSYASDSLDTFRNHVICLAGSSGGSLGNSVFYSLAHAAHHDLIGGDSFREHSARFFQADFLTHTLGRLLGPDIAQHLVPVRLPLDNRADALEVAIERSSYERLLNGYFSRPLSQLVDTTGALPALFINVTQVDNGMPGVIGTVRLGDSQRQDVLALVDSTGHHAGRGDIRLSTAVVLGARFPFVSPAGKVFDRYYVDGGYFDNSGAGTVLSFIRELNAFFSDTTEAVIRDYRDRFSFHILHLTNAEVVRRPSGDIHPLMNDMVAPVLTLAGMQGANTDIANGLLNEAFLPFNTDTANARIVFNLYDTRWAGTGFEDGYPMSWALSHYQQHRMSVALEREMLNNRSALYFPVSLPE